MSARQPPNRPQTRAPPCPPGSEPGALGGCVDIEPDELLRQQFSDAISGVNDSPAQRLLYKHQAAGGGMARGGNKKEVSLPSLIADEDEIPGDTSHELSVATGNSENEVTVFTPESNSGMARLDHGERITQYDAFLFGCIDSIADYQVANDAMSTVAEESSRRHDGESIVTETPGQPGVRFMFYILLWFLYDFNDTRGERQSSLQLQDNLATHYENMTALNSMSAGNKSIGIARAMKNANEMIAALVEESGPPSKVLQSMMTTNPEAFKGLLSVRVNFKMVFRNDGQWFLSAVEGEKDTWPLWNDLCANWAKPLNAALIIARRSTTLVTIRDARTGVGNASRATTQEISILPDLKSRLKDIQDQFPYDITSSVLSSKLGKSNLEFVLHSLSGFKESEVTSSGFGESTALSGVSVEIGQILRSCAIIGSRQQMRTSKQFSSFENESTYKYAIVMASVSSLCRIALKRVMGVEMKRGQGGVREVIRRDINEHAAILDRQDESIVDSMLALVADMSTQANSDSIERQYALYADFSNIDCVAANIISSLSVPIALTDASLRAQILRPGTNATVQLPTWAQLRNDPFVSSVSEYSTFINVLTTPPLGGDGGEQTAIITKDIVLDAFHKSVLNGMTNVRGDASSQPTLRDIESLRLKFFSTFIAKRTSTEQRRLILAGVEAIDT